jgi:hypothetical protein
MAVRWIFRSQGLSIEHGGTRSSCSGHGAGCPCSEVSLGGQANPFPMTQVASDEWNLRGKRSRDGGRREKPRGRGSLTVPQTDTGRQVEDTKAFERTLVKELGKLTP